MDQFENIVFSGGGVRGVAFCGAIMALCSLCQDMPVPTALSSAKGPPHVLPWVKRAAGASVGALFACAVALRIPSDRLFRLLDTEAILEGLVPTVDLHKLQKEYGLDDGRALREGIIRVMEVGLEQWGVDPKRATSFTFSDLLKLTNVEVLVSVTRIGSAEPGSSRSLPRSEIVSASTSPDVPVVDGLVMSMSVPFLYTPVKYNSSLYVDGGLVNNTPTVDFDYDKTLVMRLRSVPYDAEGGLHSYITSVMYAPIEWIDAENIKKYPHCVTMGSASVNAFSFKATREMLVSGVLDGMLCTFRSLMKLTNEIHAP